MTANSAAVLAELRSVRHQLDTVIAALDLGSEAGTGDGLRAQLERGVAGSRRIPGKHGAPATAYGEVVVEIPDAPGALGRLFADIGDAGVNVEDISIEHDQNRQVGYLSVAVAPAQLDRPGGSDGRTRLGCSALRRRVSSHPRVRGPGTLTLVPEPSESPDRLVVAIDGPSGSGKSSTARGVATRLGLEFLDTGAMYRAATWLALTEGLPTDDQAAVADLVRAAAIDIDTDPTQPRISINGHDVTAAIREPAVSAVVSQIATNLRVRADLIARQRALIAALGARHGGRGAGHHHGGGPGCRRTGRCWSPIHKRGSGAGTPSWVRRSTPIRSPTR